MTEQPPSQLHLGQILYNAGWRQGSLFTSPDICFYHNDLADSVHYGTEGRPPKVRELRSNEKFVLITQDCDIVRSPDVEPYVEALICTLEKKRERIDSIDRNSPRWFVISRSRGLIANARYRVVISKQSLAGVYPEPWPESETRLQRFARWLARRYARPAVPDDITEALIEPFSMAISDLHTDNPGIAALFSEVVYDIRLWIRKSPGLPHWQIRVALLSDAIGISEAQHEAVEQTVLAALGAVKGDLVSIEGWYLATNEVFSLADYFATTPVFFEYLTYQGDEIVGLEPPNEL